MAKFMAMKIHYDHRSRLPKYLKYSSVPTLDEYKEYLDLFYEGVGGEGFHECLNFSTPIEGNGYKVYLPPTSIPSESFEDEEFVLFSFTYKSDQEISASIVGIHAEVYIANREGIVRNDFKIDDSVEELIYHAETDGELATLLTTPLVYDYREGRYTPVYQSWGNGLRYIEPSHAKNILCDAYSNAEKLVALKNNDVESKVAERELEVLDHIHQRYFGAGIKSKGKKGKYQGPNFPEGIVDKEIGYRGEEFIYQREIEHVVGLGLPEDTVEWLSQGVMNSVYDIKTVRNVAGENVDHFLEVKSSKLSFGESIYLSSRQIEFFEANPKTASLVIVNYANRTENPEVRYMSLGEVLSEFSLCPIKYKLKLK